MLEAVLRFITSLHRKFNHLYSLFKRGNFTIRYIVGLSIIAFLSVALHSIVQYNLYFQDKGLKTLHLARDHNQNANELKRKLFLLQAISTESEIKTGLKQFNQDYKVFSDVATNLWVKKEKDSIQEVFKKEDSYDNSKITSVFYVLTNKIKKIKTIDIENAGERGELILESADLLDRYIKLSDLELDIYDKKYSNNLKKFRYYELFILVITLVTLVLEALFIFKPALRMLEEAQRARSDFFSRIGHEIRNPMNSILGMTTLLEKQYLNRAQKTYLFRLKKSAEGLLHFLNNVIEHSGIEQGKVTLNEDKVDIKELIEEISSLFYFDIGKKGVGFYITISDVFPQIITTDYIKLKYILINLIGNAVKFTQEGSIHLCLSFNEVTGSLILIVKDTGIGISNDKKETIFESFVQADSSVKRRYGGTGLGLSIIREYVDYLSGIVNVESEEGKGSSFTVEIPITEYTNKVSFKLPDYDIIYVQNEKHLVEWIRENADAKTEIISYDSELKKEDISDSGKKVALFIIDLRDYAHKISSEGHNVYLVSFTHRVVSDEIHAVFPAITWSIHDTKINMSKEVSHSAQLNNQKILICDDIEDNRLILNSHLEQYFCDISIANGGKDCLEMMNVNNFSFVFLDIQMPDIDGLSVIKTIKSNPKHDGTIFIAFTAHNSSREKQKMLEAGFSFILEKPINETQLRDIIKKLIPNTKEVSYSQVSFEERIKQKLLKKKPSFIKEKLEQIYNIKNSKVDIESLGKTFGHQLKGSASNYGFDSLTLLGQSIEECEDKETQLKLINEVEEILKKG